MMKRLLRERNWKAGHQGISWGFPYTQPPTGDGARDDGRNEMLVPKDLPCLEFRGGDAPTTP